MAGGMDGMMRRGSGLGGMCSSMMSELDVHAAQACGGDAAARLTETTRHCHAMREWVGQQRARLGSHCGR